MAAAAPANARLILRLTSMAASRVAARTELSTTTRSGMTLLEDPPEAMIGWKRTCRLS